MSKAQNALIYPAFVVVVFIVVMTLMLTLVIPKITAILIDSGTAVPLYTQIVIDLSNIIFTSVFLFSLGLQSLGFSYIAHFRRGRADSISMASNSPFRTLGISIKKLYLSRIADNFSTMLSSGVPVIEMVDITARL